MAKASAAKTEAKDTVSAVADLEGTEVIATQTGFSEGALRQVGDKFLFVPDFEGEEIPTWCKRADGKEVTREKNVVYAPIATRADLGDTKPANAIKAQKAKADLIANGGEDFGKVVPQSNHPEVQTAADKAGETNQIGRDGKPVVTQTKPLPPGEESGSTSFA